MHTQLVYHPIVGHINMSWFINTTSSSVFLVTCTNHLSHASQLFSLRFATPDLQSWPSQSSLFPQFMSTLSYLYFPASLVLPYNLHNSTNICDDLINRICLPTPIENIRTVPTVASSYAMAKIQTRHVQRTNSKAREVIRSAHSRTFAYLTSVHSIGPFTVRMLVPTIQRSMVWWRWKRMSTSGTRWRVFLTDYFCLSIWSWQHSMVYWCSAHCEGTWRWNVKWIYEKCLSEK